MGEALSTPHLQTHEPLLSVLIVAHNEAATIGAKIMNCLELDYPRERLQLVIASDGSSDETAAIAGAFASEGVRVVAFPGRRGKAAVLNDVLPRLDAEIVVLADARQQLDSNALRSLVRPFTDPNVGAVSGELVLRTATNGVGGGVGFYWQYEKLLRRSESAVDSTVGATGALYAIRRLLFEPIPEDTLLDDVLIPLRIVRQGYRVVFEDRARAFDRPPETTRQELPRKIRTMAGNFQLFARERWLLNPIHNRLWFQAISHKGLRLVLPLLHIGLLTANLTILQISRFYVWTLVAQVLFYAAAFVGHATRHRQYSSRLVSVPYVMCLMGWATVAGFMRFLRGRQSAAWDPTRFIEPDRAVGVTSTGAR